MCSSPQQQQQEKRMQPLARPSSPEEAEEVRSSASTSPPARGGRRRRAASEGALPLPLPRPLASSSSSERFDLGRRSPSFRRDVGHAAAETFLLTRLTLILLRYLGLGYRWITKFLALDCYAMFLMPGLLQVGCYYFFSSQVRRSVVYGNQPRNRLDLYLPEDMNEPKPVVAFVTGGAWIIGYKAWGTLLGRRLAERGVIVACIDYRNFPQGTISDMVKDVSQGISFVCNNIASYGGDPSRGSEATTLLSWQRN
ncbi:putative isoprenylcysteine alpha-carbonyl methylesterase ICMEL1 [Iris pallida]|uniref:protein-S-isoprenylcysteine alpha-carbonyl methylesterase n=1 Tax=Iris pallida TaxID=29817 RepID=A0AAX6HE87_IRIPA|nr:putative isoprenylcysteine alpha-carbonyl methylesterase ICMEL1 [Iris pallida]